MSAFALASVVGVPFGLYLGTRLGWHAPFLLLAALGCPVMAVGMRALPSLAAHMGQAAIHLSSFPHDAVEILQIRRLPRRSKHQDTSSGHSGLSGHLRVAIGDGIVTVGGS